MSDAEPSDVRRMREDLSWRLTKPVVRKGIAALTEDILPAQAAQTMIFVNGATDGDIAEGLSRSIDAATWYVISKDADEMRKWWEIANELADDETVGTPPAFNGFVVLQFPLTFPMAPGFEVNVHVITWTAVTFPKSGEPYVLLTFWTDRQRDPDDKAYQMVQEEMKNNPEFSRFMNAMGRWQLVHMFNTLPVFTQVGPREVDLDIGAAAESMAQGWNPPEQVPNIARLITAMFRALTLRYGTHYRE